ncbi:2-methylcitrate synthase [hydrothermal vent metagenome]|uniref:citrate synthase (unknown stereospecificity) n=1 Tax=hydrothermal vent metagenome TaxID=652676 RepID=A0A3B1DM70_9ZZZZ
MTDQVHQGLEGVLAGQSAICDVNHVGGGLEYRGYAISDLAGKASFEEVAFLLLVGVLPNPSHLAGFKETLLHSRFVPKHLIDFLNNIPTEINRMDALRTAVSILGMEDPDADKNDHDANLRKAIRLTAQMPALLGALRGKKQVFPSDISACEGHAEYLLKFLCDDPVDELGVRALEVALILYAEHEFNASTFAARVTASSLSDMHSAVVSGIGTLKGPLHGGANEAVMEMLFEVDRVGDVAKYLSKKFAKKERIMGFGHRVLKKGDARSDIIQFYSKALGEQKGEKKWYDYAIQIEKIMREEKGFYPNLDFYSASVFYLLNLPVPLYTPLFVCSRVTGWAAHVIEQHDQNRLIRPRCQYTGEKGLSFVPLSEREVV